MFNAFIVMFTLLVYFCTQDAKLMLERIPKFGNDILYRLGVIAKVNREACDAPSPSPANGGLNLDHLWGDLLCSSVFPK